MVGLPRKTLFIDRNTGGERIRDFLNRSGILFTLHDDHFDRMESDSVWLKAVGKKGWPVVSGDWQLRKNFAFLMALRASETHVFILKELNHAVGEQRANIIIASYEEMVKTCANNSGPMLWLKQQGHEMKAFDFRHELGILKKYGRFDTH